jgi:competence protein ComEC
MRTVAAIPAIGLLAGAASGLLLPDASVIAYAALVMCTAAAVWAWRAARPSTLALAVGAAFFAGGALLAADAWREAWRPSLRIVFQALARAERAAAVRGGRRLPEDGTARAIVTGVLRADATPRPNGVSLSLDVRSVAAVEDADPERVGLQPSASARIDPGRPTLSGSVRADSRRRTLSGSAPSEALSEDSARTARQLRSDEVQVAVTGGVLLTVSGSLAPEQADDWRAGRIIRAPVQLRRPSRYLNPGVVDEERALARRGTTLVGSVKSGALVEIVREGSALSEGAWRLRSFVRRAIAAAVGRWSSRSSAIVTAIVIGDRAGLDDDLQRRLQEAGTYHVIAISGGNIAILAGLTLVVFRMAGLLGRAAMLAAIAGLLAYAYLVGGGASVNRATLMAVVYFAGRAIDLRGPPANALALVAAVLVATDPLAVADPAFLLTCGATAAILLVVPNVSVRSLPRTIAPAAAILAASIAAEAALMPIGAYLFARVTFAGLLLNFAAIPLMAVAQIAGMAAVPAFAVSPPLALAVGWIAHLGAEGLVRSADLVPLVPLLTWRVAPPHWAALLLYYVGLSTGWALWRRRREITGSSEGSGARLTRRAATATAGAAAIWILFEPSRLLTIDGDDRLHVTFVDVGQGDAAFVRFPHGATLLVDAGGFPGSSSFDIGDRIVGAALRHAGIRRIGTVALTHGDADHIGGAASVLREFRPRDVWEGIPVPRSEPLGALYTAASLARSRWTNVQTNDRYLVDGVTVAVRHPQIADWERQDVRNDDSIVLELAWRDVSIVFTGDIGREVEAAIVPHFGPAGIRVVKVPHHGSLTSSSWTFVDALAPRVAVVSAGRSNTFGHPAPAVLDRYRRAGAQIFRTDQDGAVMLNTDGYSVEVRTFTGRMLTVK